MNVFNRVVVSLIALALLAGGVVMLLTITGALGPEQVLRGPLSDQLTSIAATEGASWWTNIGIAIGLVVVGLVLLWLELIRPLTSRPKMVLLSHEAEGSAFIALNSIRDLAERTMQQHPNVRQAQCRIRQTSRGLRVGSTVMLDTGSDVPRISAEIRNSVKEELERLVGLPVTDVAVRVRYSGAGQRPVLVS
jgi:hypothetical protein